MLKPLDACRLYTFVDVAYLQGRDPLDLCRALCDGGSDLIQLRAKGWPDSEVLRLARRLAPAVAEAGVWFVVNDHPQLAAEVGAPLCHLGQEDFFEVGHTHVCEVVAGTAGMGVGLSSHAPEQALRAERAGAAYVAVGPVFATPTKPGRPAVTLEYVRWAAAHLRAPWFAIGGITNRTLDAVLEAGARRVCVVSAILQAPDVARACQFFHDHLTSASS